LFKIVLRPDGKETGFLASSAAVEGGKLYTLKRDKRK